MYEGRIHLWASEVNQNKVLKNARRKLLDAASSFGVLDLALGASKKSEHKDDFSESPNSTE